MFQNFDFFNKPICCKRYVLQGFKAKNSTESFVSNWRPTISSWCYRFRSHLNKIHQKSQTDVKVRIVTDKAWNLPYLLWLTPFPDNCRRLLSKATFFSHMLYRTDILYCSLFHFCNRVMSKNKSSGIIKNCQ